MYHKIFQIPQNARQYILSPTIGYARYNKQNHALLGIHSFVSTLKVGVLHLNSREGLHF